MNGNMARGNIPLENASLYSESDADDEYDRDYSPIAESDHSYSRRQGRPSRRRNIKSPNHEPPSSAHAINDRPPPLPPKQQEYQYKYEERPPSPPPPPPVAAAPAAEGELRDPTNGSAPQQGINYEASMHKLIQKPVTSWTARQCAGFISTLGMGKYSDLFFTNAIVGEALIHLNHADLRKLGVPSLGHRITLLKSIYDVKIAQGVPFEPDAFVPISATMDVIQDAREDVNELANEVRLRDERISLLEQTLRGMKVEVERLSSVPPSIQGSDFESRPTSVHQTKDVTSQTPSIRSSSITSHHDYAANGAPTPKAQVVPGPFARGPRGGVGTSRSASHTESRSEAAVELRAPDLWSEQSDTRSEARSEAHSDTRSEFWSDGSDYYPGIIPRTPSQTESHAESRSSGVWDNRQEVRSNPRPAAGRVEHRTASRASSRPEAQMQTVSEEIVDYTDSRFDLRSLSELDSQEDSRPSSRNDVRMISRSESMSRSESLLKRRRGSKGSFGLEPQLDLHRKSRPESLHSENQRQESSSTVTSRHQDARSEQRHASSTASQPRKVDQQRTHSRTGSTISISQDGRSEDGQSERSLGRTNSQRRLLSSRFSDRGSPTQSVHGRSVHGGENTTTDEDRGAARTAITNAHLAAIQGHQHGMNHAMQQQQPPDTEDEELEPITPKDLSMESMASMASLATMMSIDPNSKGSSSRSPTSPHISFTVGGSVTTRTTSARSNRSESIAGGRSLRSAFSDVDRNSHQNKRDSKKTHGGVFAGKASDYAEVISIPPSTPTPSRASTILDSSSECDIVIENGERSETGSRRNSLEVFKSFRVSMTDPCYKVLPAALRRYAIFEPYHNYALYIFYGGKKRLVDYDEHPLYIYKKVAKLGYKSTFMLRKVRDDEDPNFNPETAGFIGFPMGPLPEHYSPKKVDRPDVHTPPEDSPVLVDPIVEDPAGEAAVM